MIPFYRSEYPASFNYFVYTSATSGSIFTQYFGEEFDADKVETGPLTYYLSVYPPASAKKNNPNVTLHFEFEMVSMKDLSSGYDTLREVLKWKILF